MNVRCLLAEISRQFLRNRKIYRLHTKKVSEMTDDEVISYCHRYCEANNLICEWKQFRTEVESEFRYCSYMKEFIDDGLCYDMQMVSGGYISASVLPEIPLDKEECLQYCAQCKYAL